MTDKNKNRFFFWALVPLWSVLILWNLFTPASGFSEAENRYLAAFPKFSVETLLDGRFMDRVNTYLNDQFAGRPFWVSGQGLMEFALGKREVNGVFLGKNALLADLKPEDTEYMQKNIIGINSFGEQYGIPCYVMLVPASASVQPEKLPRYAVPWDEAAYITSVYGLLSGDVSAVPVFGELMVSNKEYIYYRTDHHWTSYGAYIAYRELADKMGLTVRRREDMSVRTLSTDFYGTYHSKTVFPLVEADTMELYENGTATSYEVFDGKELTTYSSAYFDEYLDKKDKYSYYFGQVQPYVTIRTASESGKRLIVFKDSYAHCLIPMLMEDFSEIRMVDLRYFNTGDFKEQLEIGRYDEALFLYSADVFAHQIGAGKLA